MKILFLSHRLPYPPNEGSRIRPFNIIKYLAKKHKITVVTLLASKEEWRFVELLKEYVDEVICCLQRPLMRRLKCLATLLSPQTPLSLSYFFSRKLKNLIKDKLAKEKFDLIFVYSSSMAQYVIDISRNIPKILDLCDVDSAKWLEYVNYTQFPYSLIYKLEGLRLRKYEGLITRKFNHCLIISAQEKELLESITDKGLKIDILPIGIDYQLFKRKPKDYTPNTLIITGVMNYYANVDGVNYFYKEIFPLIKKEIKDVKFYVVGRNPHKSIQKLARDKCVIVTGKVDDVKPYLEKAAVCVVPLRIARGIQNKILEAMAMGLPVVTTKKAIEGINATDEVEVLIEDNPEEFAKKTIKLLKDMELRDKITSNARKMIEKNYNWGKIVDKLNEDVLEKIAIM